MPANKGKKCPEGVGGRHPNARRSQFKKGQEPHNTKHLGHERLSKDGYVEISVAETNPHTGYGRRYVHKHVHLWEALNGPVPEGHCLKSLDGDRTNTAPANWIAIPRGALPRLNGGRASRVSTMRTLLSAHTAAEPSDVVAWCLPSSLEELRKGDAPRLMWPTAVQKHMEPLYARPLALGGQQGDSETLRVLLDNLVIAQTLSKDIRQKATDEARSYLYDLRHTPQPSGETRDEVARIVDPAAFLFKADELMKGDTSQYDAFNKADRILALVRPAPVASGGQQGGGEDFVVVPINPTEEMLKAGNQALSAWVAPAMHAGDAYQAMIATRHFGSKTSSRDHIAERVFDCPELRGEFDMETARKVADFILSTTPARAEAQDEDTPCTDCGDTGVTHQTERRCSCQEAEAQDEGAIKAAYKRGWNDRESDIIERAERIAPMNTPAQDEGAAGYSVALLASYCGDDTSGCTDKTPCLDCVKMANVYKVPKFALGEFVGELGNIAAPSPTPAADEDRVRIAVKALEWIDGNKSIAPVWVQRKVRDTLAALKSTAAKEGGANDRL